jgi:hypothetical protein
MFDSLFTGFPLYYNGARQTPLLMGIVLTDYNLYVAARTTLADQPTFLPWANAGPQPQGQASRLYYSEAFMNWNLRTTAVWNGGIIGKVTGSNSVWQRQQLPFMPEVNVVASNVGSNSPFATWD